MYQRVYLFTGLDWTTGLTFDPKILAKTCNFALIGNPRMLSYPFSGQEDTNFMLTRNLIKHSCQAGEISYSSYF